MISNNSLNELAWPDLLKDCLKKKKRLPYRLSASRGVQTAVLYQKWVEHFADQTGSPFLGVASIDKPTLYVLLVSISDPSFNCMGNFFFF